MNASSHQRKRGKKPVGGRDADMVTVVAPQLLDEGMVTATFESSIRMALAPRSTASTLTQWSLVTTAAFE